MDDEIITIDELIKYLEVFRKEHGNLKIGIYNKEFGCFDVAYNVLLKQSSFTDNDYSEDDKDLGIVFVGID